MKWIAGCLTAALLTFTSSLVLADSQAPETAPRGIALINADVVAKIREEARLQENRARELEPILARDRQARHDVEVDWGVLERHGRELHAKANEFRQLGNVVGGKGQQELNGFASEFDTNATHDEENARAKHEMAERLDRLIASEANARDWHLRHAARLREWLSANGA